MRHPSIRGIGVRYLIASLLPITGAALVVYTAIELAVAHLTNQVPPPRRISEASLPADFNPPTPQEVAPGAPPETRSSR